MERETADDKDIRVSIDEKPKVDRCSYYLGYADGMRGALLLGIVALLGSAILLKLRE